MWTLQFIKKIAHEHMGKPSSKAALKFIIGFISIHCFELPIWPKFENSFRKLASGTLLYLLCE